MRREQAQAPARLVVDEAVALVAEHAAHGDAGRGLVERDRHVVDDALRAQPFLVDAHLAQFVERQEIGPGERLLDLGKELPARERIEPDVALEIQPVVVRIDAAVGEEQRALPGRRILGEQAGRGAADEARDLPERVGPPRRVERRIVDAAGERQEGVRLAHGRAAVCRVELRSTYHEPARRWSIGLASGVSLRRGAHMPIRGRPGVPHSVEGRDGLRLPSNSVPHRVAVELLRGPWRFGAAAAQPPMQRRPRCA